MGKGKRLVFLEPRKEFRHLLVYTRRTGAMTPELLGLAVRRLGRMKMWQAAFLLLTSVCKAELQVDSAPYVAAVDACRTVERWDLALDCLACAKQEGLAPTNVSNAASAAILRCRSTFGWPQMLQLLTNLVDGQRADELSFGMVLAACSQSHNWQLAVRLIELMKDSKVTPDLVQLSTAAAACNRAETSEAWRWSLHFFSLARWLGQSPNLVLHNCAISAVSGSHGSSWPLAMLKLQDIMEARLQPDAISFTTACAACQRTAAVDQAWQLLKELPKATVRACEFFYSTLVMTGAAGLRWQESATLLPRLKANVRTRESFLGAMVLGRQWREAALLFTYDTFKNQVSLARKSDLIPALQVCRETGSIRSAAWTSPWEV